MRFVQIPAMLVLPTVLGSCNATAIGFGAVSIRPIYGYVDGCNAVRIGGHGFDSDVAVTIGGQPITEATLPEEGSLDRGFMIDGVAPAGGPGYADVVVTNGDGQSTTISETYYYVACPSAFYPEALGPNEGIASGTEITVAGCNLNGATQVQVGDADPVPLTPGCGNVTATFSAPNLEPSDEAYPIRFLDAAGDEQFSQPCDGDTGDTALPDCDAYGLTYGGAE